MELLAISEAVRKILKKPRNGLNGSTSKYTRINYRSRKDRCAPWQLTEENPILGNVKADLMYFRKTWPQCISKLVMQSGASNRISSRNREIGLNQPPTRFTLC